MLEFCHQANTVHTSKELPRETQPLPANLLVRLLGSYITSEKDLPFVGAEGGILQGECHLVLFCPPSVVFKGLTMYLRVVLSA